MKVIIAIDSFKGCLNSIQAADAARQGVLQVCPDAQVMPMPVSDGGEGMLEAFIAAMGGDLVPVTVHDPLMRLIDTHYAVSPDGTTAIIEMAKASGLSLLTPDERNPLIATSYGTGELIAHALERGCKRIIVGLGDSATSDCGKGMLEAMGMLIEGGYEFLYMCDRDFVYRRHEDVEVIIAGDVRNQLLGPQGAAHVFARQKGATAAMVQLLEQRARHLVRSLKYNEDKRLTHKAPGAGAAGGLGYALMVYLNATMRSGAELLLDVARFDEMLRDADLVITGEGRADAQTLMGKLPQEVMRRAKAMRVPTVLVAGGVADAQKLLDAGFARVAGINPHDMPLDECLRPEVATRNLVSTVAKVVSTL